MPDAGAAAQQSVGRPLNVAALDDIDKLGEALERSLPHLGPEAREEIEKLLDPTTLAIVAGVIVAWIASHFIGIGEIIDVILLAVGVFAIGLAIFEGVDELLMFGTKALSARSETQLDEAGRHFANAVAILGVQAVLAVLFRGTPKSFKGPRPGVGRPPPGRRVPRQIRRDPTLPPGHGETSWWGQIKISPHGTAADRRLVALHEKVHQILTPKIDILRNFRVKGRAASYQKSSLSRYLEEAIAEAVGQLGVNGFKAAFSGVSFPVKNGYVTLLRRAGDVVPVLPETIGLIAGSFLVAGMRFDISVSENPSRPPRAGPDTARPTPRGAAPAGRPAPRSRDMHAY